jgi:hypothetical protein
VWKHYDRNEGGRKKGGKEEVNKGSRGGRRNMERRERSRRKRRENPEKELKGK